MKIARLAVLLLLPGLSFAQTTRSWEQSRYEDFEKGTAKGIALRSDGTLELAPEMKAIATTGSTYIWSVANDTQGNLFAAAGSPSRVYRITPDGKTSVVLAPPELQVQAVTVASDGTVYAATSPDGKVYKLERKATAAQSARPANDGRSAEGSKVELDPGYSSSVFFDPKTKYIWALAVDRDGRLYVATGDRGEIYRVEKNGTGALFFKSDEAHLRALAFDSNGNLIAGSDGSGLLYRISPKGEGFVLYSAQKKEITSLAVDNQGNIYASAAGDKRAVSTQASLVYANMNPGPLSLAAFSGQASQAPGAGQPGAGQQGTTPALPLPGVGATGSEIYRIASDGSPKRIWTSKDDLVYALGFDRNGRLIAGTGNKGKIFAISGTGNYTNLAKVSANQVVGFAKAANGDVFAATSNLGKIILLQDTAQREGTFDSEVFDARILSRWGRAEMRSQGAVELQTRSGNVDNPDRNWSQWTKVDVTKDVPVSSPPARFIQWRAVLRSGNTAPEVDSVRINYLPKNIAPEIEDVTVAVGQKIGAAPRTTADAGANVAGAAPNAPGMIRDRDSITIRWAAFDENDDPLSYSVYYRGDNETRWKLLKSGLADKFYSFDSNLLPDGGYTVKVVASDAAVHSPGEALTAERVSTRFEVDNTPPAISKLGAVAQGDKLRISFTATDAMSVIKRAEYSVDGSDWHFVAPVDGISDSKTENYDFTVPVEASGAQEEHLVAVRVYDRADNMSMAKYVFRPGATR